MKLFNWRIRNKLLVGFSLVLFLMAAIGGYTFIYSKGIEQQTGFMSQTASMNLDIVEKLKVATIQVQQFLTDASATGTTDGINEAKEWAEKFRGYVNEMHTKCTLCHSKVFKDSPKDMPDVEAKIIEMSANFETYYEIGKKMTNIYIKEGREAGNKLMPEFDSAAKKINKELDRRTQMAKKHFTKSWNDVNQSTKRAREWTLFIVLAAVAIGILVAFFIAKKIENPVADVVKMADKIAQGDLTCKDLNIQSGDEMELLAASLNKMKGTLNEIMQHVVNGVTHLASASEQLSASSTQIAKGTDEQTQRASTVATASEEMSATIIEVAKNASGAAEAAKEANNLARNGGDIVQKTVEGMNDIAKSVKDSAGVIATLGERSREIGKIIKV
ncbi:MAG: HAMP domain-containing protein [Deltaproteobacteria bacterium]|nr:HAMP domain-containing protein [Deltaproteobacteria bacterium]